MHMCYCACTCTCMCMCTTHCAYVCPKQNEHDVVIGDSDFFFFKLPYRKFVRRSLKKVVSSRRSPLGENTLHATYVCCFLAARLAACVCGPLCGQLRCRTLSWAYLSSRFPGAWFSPDSAVGSRRRGRRGRRGGAAFAHVPASPPCAARWRCACLVSG
jgi:hypothetical protein